MNPPQTQEYPEWGKTYIKLVEGDVIELLTQQASDFPNFINNLIEKGDYAYAPGKWTIKELIGHIIDTERILVYRLLCIARGEKAALPGFEEDDYVASAHFKDRSLFSFSEEFALMRKSNMYFINSLNEAELSNVGNANGKDMTARSLVFVLAGHILHHVNVIKERYL
ncbi:DinB family protein [Pedobacter frigiditerrae]|uniref:DinB family protein n=1 Tax=Pedobacter frigiditerrae TaxID=2530452 RepID=A0A4R0N5F6_9SPHI|nr:DinB family protein [Pedobacter frigiditerrae]TCC93842.1 DinB family protein [Pedobacter frigiditerrae]